MTRRLLHTQQRCLLIVYARPLVENPIGEKVKCLAGRRLLNGEIHRPLIMTQLWADLMAWSCELTLDNTPSSHIGMAARISAQAQVDDDSLAW